MNNVINIIKMDMAICRKSIIIMILSMLAFGVGCLFFATPLLLGLFVVGSTSVVSVIFSVESKSNMEYFYGCFPVQKKEYITGRSLTCLLIIAIPSVICIAFTQIGMHFSLCRIAEMRLVMDLSRNYQMIIICGMIMLGFISGANLLLVSFAGKIESRELLEVILLLSEALIVSIIVFFIQKVIYNGNMQELQTKFINLITRHELISCILLVLVGLIVLVSGSIVSLKLVERKRT